MSGHGLHCACPECEEVVRHATHEWLDRFSPHWRGKQAQEESVSEQATFTPAVVAERTAFPLASPVGVGRTYNADIRCALPCSPDAPRRSWWRATDRAAGTRRCARCAEVKPLDAYHRNATKALGRDYGCKSCRAAKRRRTKAAA